MLRRNLKIGLIFSLAVLVIYLISDVNDGRSTKIISDHLETSEIALLQEGDLIMRRGFGLVSTFILKVLNEDYSITHIGMLTKRDGKWHVAHSLSNNYAPKDGVQLQDIEDFLADSYDDSILITRLKGVKDFQKSAIRKKLSHYIALEIPFDHQFDYKDTTAFYCSELPFKILDNDLKILQFEPNLSDKEKYHSLRPFYNDKYFDIIINHHQ